MNRFKKIAAFIVLFEILIIIVANIMLINNRKEKARFYAVEAKRIVKELESGIIPSKIDLSKYEYIVNIREFNPDEICNMDYLVEKAGDKLYRIEYEKSGNSDSLYVINAFMVAFLLINILLLIYIRIKILKPFNDMSDMTYDLAKGNLLRNVKEDKNRFFGKFLWGIDMLRENLLDSHAKNLEYQKEKKTLMISLSHDIKTPLSSIELCAKALEDGIYEDENEKRKALDKILKNVKEIRSYVDEIYKLSREEIMEFKVNPTEIYLKSIVNKLCTYYEDKLSVLHMKFNVADFEDVLVKGDGDRLLEAMQNLMENAIKYGDKKAIDITFGREEDCILMTFFNGGCSLSEREIPNLFDSFYRGSNSDKIPGNGLGLYIVKQLMRRMDGDVYVALDNERFNATLVIRMI